jgi:type II secretory pathway component PulL
MLRRGRPILRTAAIVGTASVVGGAVQHHQQQKYAAQDAEAQQEAYQQAAPPAAAPEPDLNAELTQLAQLHDQGILTDEEFAAKKAQILGI